MTKHMPQQIIITGDDFGLSAENNEGIMLAYRDGVLSCTSLMVGGNGMDEAVDIARRHPNLSVGLHIAFSDTKPVLPPDEVPMLVQSDGYFPPDDRAHQTALWSIRGRQQVRAEIAAQFRRFHETGLRCDHVNSHRHVHMRHPLLPLMVFREAARWGIKAVRTSCDPPPDLIRHTRNTVLRHMAAFYGLKSPDRTIGRSWSPQAFLELLPILSNGMTELYFHPTTAQDHAYSADLPTLLNEKVRTTVIGMQMRYGFTNV
jgi:predicted glycoside hydrolase/deacetylase ChbG (UPF0249 family)